MGEETMVALSHTKRLSLWLLPPEPIAKSLSQIQADIILQHPKGWNLPRFLPHVTLIGGVPIAKCCSIEEVSSYQNAQSNIDIDEEAAKIVLKRLQHAFESFGAITCEFNKERGVFAGRMPPENGVGNGAVKWNQSCVSIIEMTESFTRAMQVADEALFSTTDPASCERGISRHFKPPVNEPHYSYAYGNDSNLIPDSLECPDSFASLEMVLIWTYPAELGCVESWAEIGRINLQCKHQESSL